MKIISRIFILTAISINCFFANATDATIIPLSTGAPQNLNDIWDVQILFTSDNTGGTSLYEIELILAENNKGRLLIERTKAFAATSYVTINENTISNFKPFTNNYKNASFFNSFNSLGRFPAGIYTATFNLYKKSGGSEESISKAETTFAVDEYGAILLQYPSNEDTINEMLPTFNWLLLGNKDAGCSFEMVLKEVHKNQTATDAMLYNAVYNTIRAENNFYPYQPVDRPLQEGGHYTWMVKYLCNGKVVLNSDIWSFIIKKQGMKNRGYIDPNAFIKLKDIDDGGAVVIKDRILKLKYQTALNDKDEILNYKIIDDRGKEVMNPSIYSLKVSSGDNRYLISLCAEEGYYLKTGKYKFIVIDDEGRTWFMNFLIDSNSSCN
jgi:hypothetical protein